MRLFWSLAVCVALFSCAAKNVVIPQECSREAGLARGAKDGRSVRGPDLSFLQYCVAETRNAALSAYRESFDAAKAKRARDEVGEDPNVAVALPQAERSPAGQNWVCEVEANSKVFTGTGLSRDEALGSAKSTCVSHFQQSYCNASECKQTL